MEVFPDYEQVSKEEGRYCSLDDIQDARRVAARLGIPHYIFNLKKEFQKAVIDNFVAEYANARTPNPCVICNREIKFKALLKKALEFQVDYLATGHYAKIIHKNTGRHLLKKATDKEKDQSYMLYVLSQFQLEHTLMPLGDYKKSEIRKIAKNLGFVTHDKTESQDICFVPDDDYIRFLDENYSGYFEPGPIFNEKGEKLGEHGGLHHYTVGQRKGLGIAAGYPLYVTALDQKRNAVIVGENEEVYTEVLYAEKLNWISIPELRKPIEVKIRIRYNSREVPATIYPLNNDRVKVVFKEKQRAVTPGQSVVFYDKDLVVGGGIII